MSWWSTIGGVAGGIGGFIVGGPAGALTGYGLGSSLGATIEGGKAQKRGLGASEGALKYGYEHGLAEYGPYADWGRGGIEDYGTAMQRLEAPMSGESPYYKWQSQVGLKNVRQGLAARGLLGSGAGMAAEGQFLNQLGAEESLREYQRRMERIRLAQERMGIGAGVAGARAGLWTGQGDALAGVKAAQGAANAQMYSGLARLPFDVASTYIMGRESGLWGGTPNETTPSWETRYGGGRRASGAY